MTSPVSTSPVSTSPVSEKEALAAVRTLLRFAGEDPEREGLQQTPQRVINAFAEYFSGYHEDPKQALSRTFSESENYDDMIVLRGIRVSSHCEHHMAPILGRAHVAYLPRRRVVGISKLARVVDIYARRLQIQEKLTAQIANTIQEVLRPRGVGVIIQAQHLCMACRGVAKSESEMITSRLLGSFRTDSATRREFMSLAQERL